MMLYAGLIMITALFGGEEINCVVSGCSNHLCLEESVARLTASTCEWREEYGCYAKYSTCEVQDDGKCGWTQTNQLMHCLTYPKTKRPDFSSPHEIEDMPETRSRGIQQYENYMEKKTPGGVSGSPGSQ